NPGRVAATVAEAAAGPHHRAADPGRRGAHSFALRARFPVRRPDLGSTGRAAGTGRALRRGPRARGARGAGKTFENILSGGPSNLVKSCRHPEAGQRSGKGAGADPAPSPDSSWEGRGGSIAKPEMCARRHAGT